MEKSKKIDLSNRPADQEQTKDWIGGAGCPVWIFGNGESADNDMKEKFEIVDEDKSNK